MADRLEAARVRTVRDTPFITRKRFLLKAVQVNEQVQPTGNPPPSNEFVHDGGDLLTEMPA